MSTTKRNADEKAIFQKATKELDSQFCFPIDWCDEELPLENKEGNVMDKLVQSMIDDTHNPSILEHFSSKPPAGGPPKLDVATASSLGSVLVFPDADGIAAGILENAPQGRLGQKKVVSGNQAELSQDEIDKLLSPGWDLVLFCTSLDLPATNDVMDIITHQTYVTRLFFYIAKVLSSKEDLVKKIAVVTRNIFSNDSQLHNSLGLRSVTSGTLFGMINTTRTEIPVPIHFIDTEHSMIAPHYMQQQSLLPKLASEVFRSAGFGQNTVRILHEGRFVLRQQTSTKYESAKQPFMLPGVGTVVAITGGNGALGLVFGEWLVDKALQEGAGGFTIKFLSRSAKVNDQNMPAWKAIQKKAAKLDIKAEQTKCDFSTEISCDEFIAANSPNLFGIIHSAGVLQDKLLMNLTWDLFDGVWDPKHRAAIYLHDALERNKNPSFSFFWMFSSTSVFGNPGQINYSASNAYLDALCRYRKATGRPALAIQWGAWGEVGMAANLDAASKKRFAAGPMPPFLTKEGIDGLEAGLKTGLPGFSVFKYNPEPLFKMVEACDTVTACYSRNFTSEIAPTTGAPSFDRFHLYTMYRMLREGHYGRVQKKLLYEKFVRPAIDDQVDSSWW